MKCPNHPYETLLRDASWGEVPFEIGHCKLCKKQYQMCCDIGNRNICDCLKDHSSNHKDQFNKEWLK